MEETTAVFIAEATIKLRDLINVMPEWKQRYIVRSLVNKVICTTDKPSEYSKTELTETLKEL